MHSVLYWAEENIFPQETETETVGKTELASAWKEMSRDVLVPRTLET